jgi:hypothetical protein
MMAVLRSLGNKPVERELFMICAKEGNSRSNIDFISVVGKISTEGDVLILQSLATSEAVKGLKDDKDVENIGRQAWSADLLGGEAVGEAELKA